LITAFLQSYDLNTLQWVLLALSGLLIGMAKTGLSGFGMMVVPILANAFGGRPSVGLLLPILIFADVFAVSWYNRHADWKHVLRLIALGLGRNPGGHPGGQIHIGSKLQPASGSPGDRGHWDSDLAGPEVG
jgi:uncharacterized membrane protein YfcA